MTSAAPVTDSAPRTPLWVIIAAAGFVVALTGGLRQVAGLYMPPVTQSLGTGVEPFSTAMAIAALVWGFGGIFGGALADKYGAGRVAVIGAILTMAGYYSMYVATTGLHLTIAGIGMGLGTGFCGVTVMVGVVGRYASPEKRTSAIAAVVMANGIGNFLAFPYTHVLMETLGWRNSLLAVIATLALILPCAWFLRGKPKGAAPGTRPQTLREALNEAFGLPSYWLLICGFFVCGFHVAFYSTHLPSYALSLGLPSWVPVTALTCVGIANIIGTFLSGQSAKYIEKRRGLSIIYLVRCAVFLTLLYVPMNAPTLILLSSLLGLFWLATIPLTSGLVATFFGTTWLAVLFGVVNFSHQLGSFLGVWLAGVVFDATKSYDLMWWISAGLGLFAALIHWPIREEGVPRLRAKPA